ncbi:MAG: hypothetical protein GY710_24320 [Desulfobacteraceae bacterium]|nr:hypothetical protein [Desulfobacteraceae bacterium]
MVRKTGAYKEIHTLYCPTCHKPNNEVVEALDDVCVVLRCTNCDNALASGHFIGFKAICPKCGFLVVVS